MNHTPGPWKVSGLDPNVIGPVRVLVVPDSNVVPQLQAVCRVMERGADATAANAHLIAAAPDLLYALQLTQRTMSGSFREGWTIQVTGHEMNAIQGAIAHATAIGPGPAALVTRIRALYHQCVSENADLYGGSLLDLAADNIPGVSLVDLKRAIVESGVEAIATDRIRQQIAGYR